MVRAIGKLGLMGVLLGAGAVSAQELAPPVHDGGPKNVFSVAPLGVASGLLALEYERVVSDGLSLTFAPDLRVVRGAEGLGGYDPFASGERLLTLSGGLRWYMLGTAPSGLWLSPELGTVLLLRRQDGATTQDLAVPRAAATLGVSGVVGGWLSLSAGAGVQFLSVVPLPNLRLQMGVAF